MKNSQLIKTVVEILDSYNSMYSALSGGRANSYLEYIKLKKADEITLIQPKIFPDFFEHILDFSPKLDYIPELTSGKSGRPDFTPNDEFLHNYVFEIKGTDSSRDEFISEYHKKAKGYIHSSRNLQYAIITNMVDLIVINKDKDKLEEDYSFSFKELYTSYKNKQIFDIKNKNISKFLKFVEKFHKKTLTTEKKIEIIAKAQPYEPLDITSLEGRYKEFEKITDSVRKIVEWFEDDAKNRKGPAELLKNLKNLPDRKLSISNEIYSICNEISNTYTAPPPEKITANDLETLFSTSNDIEKRAIGIFFYRTAYFVMSRIMLIRAWEDSRFIEEKYQTLYDGGFARWYFDVFNKKLSYVLKQAFSFAKEKYGWLFKDDTNYSWYIPSDEVLVDVLYEFARYNLSVLNRDILGVVYEDYLDIQDKKNKGQYYTPYPITELIWDKLSYYNDKDFYRYKKRKREPKLVFDPAIGSGGFLVEAARRLRSGTYFHQKKKTLEEIKNAIINGLYGSEISAFSYYIAEINLLIQLTPVIKQLIELDESRREAEGKFTLGVVRADSLGLHNVAYEGKKNDESKEEKDPTHDFLKPIGEKLRMRNFIKSCESFDYVVANPPYIGEDSHKELFRRTLRNYPYWNKHFQGKMNYLYFFVILGIQKLKEEGKLGFITTSYWLTADGASKLRDYILRNTKIIEIINFHEIKLFEHAPGQHNIVFILEKCSSTEKRKRNRIKLVEVKKKFDGKTVNEKIRNLCVHIRQYSKKVTYEDEYVKVYSSPIGQGELTDKAWYLFHSLSEEEILNKIEKNGEKLGSLCEVNQGVVTKAHKVNKSTLENLSRKTIEEYNIKKGNGVFVLNKNELEKLNLDENESRLIKPFYKNSNIARYLITKIPEEEYLIYTTKDTKIEDFPKIKHHLNKFKSALEAKVENYEEKYPWFKLHREREQRIFENEKIVCPYRSKINVFGYTEDSFYGSTDIYFITSKKDRRIDERKYELKYVLGILNSNVMRLWTHHKTKPKGKMRELFYAPLTEFSIKPINFDDHDELDKYKKIIKLVEKIISLKRDLMKYDPIFTPNISTLTEEGRIPDEINEQEIVNLMNEKDQRALSNSDLISYEGIEPYFILKNVDKNIISENISGKTKSKISITGKNKEKCFIYGEIDILKYLQKALPNFYGKTWGEIEENLILPRKISILDSKISNILKEVESKREEIQKVQEDIDHIVCELYGLEKTIIDEIILNLS